MSISSKALAIIKNNTHLPPSILQNLLDINKHYVPIQQIADIIAAIKEHNEAHMVVAPSGLTVKREDLDEILQYALAGGMPQDMIQK